jgi:hypothetical protein
VLSLLPGTEVRARSLRWKVVLSQQLGEQTLYRLRGLDGPLRGRELDLLSPFEPIVPVVQGFQPDWLNTTQQAHEVSFREQAIGPLARPDVQRQRRVQKPLPRTRWRRWQRGGCESLAPCLAFESSNCQTSYVPRPDPKCFRTVCPETKT